MCKYTGHKVWWYDHKEWKARQDARDSSFWEEHKTIKEQYKEDPKGHPILREVSFDAKVGSLYERKALNSPTQATGIIILKTAMTNFFKWIMDNNLFGIVRICNLVHDEAVAEYPETMPHVSEVLKNCMESAAEIYCKSLPIPAEPAIGKHWIH